MGTIQSVRLERLSTASYLTIEDVPAEITNETLPAWVDSNYPGWGISEVALDNGTVIVP